MQDFQDDIKTRITFHELDNDGTQIECNVHSKKSQLFYNTNGDLFDNDILPAIYLVDNRTNCHDLVADGGNITVKFIGAIRGPGPSSEAATGAEASSSLFATSSKSSWTVFYLATTWSSQFKSVWEFLCIVD